MLLGVNRIITTLPVTSPALIKVQPLLFYPAINAFADTDTGSFLRNSLSAGALLTQSAAVARSRFPN